MDRAPSRCVWSLAGAFAFAAFAGAAELTTDAERSHRELRKSSDAATQLLAQRWHGLVRFREWTDETGQFKTRAKYVEHDPALAWVKLRVIQGTGDERVVKDIEVPIAKLSKTCQSRVRQIAFLAEKVSAAVAAEQQAAADEEAGREGDETFGPAGDERDGLDMEFADVDSYDDDLDSRSDGRGNPGAAPRARRRAPTRIAGRGEPLPAMLPPLPRGAMPSTTDSAMVAREAVAAFTEPADSSEAVRPPNLADDDPWRTDYEAFRANFVSAADGTISLRQRWIGVAQMQDLAVMDQRMRRGVAMDMDEPADPNLFLPLNVRDGVGEFVWEATINKPVGSDANWTEVLNLPPLPEPLKIEFRLDEEQGAGHWRQFRVGHRVHFIGRLAGFAGENVWVAAIRFPTEDQLAAGAGPRKVLPRDYGADYESTDYD